MLENTELKSLIVKIAACAMGIGIGVNLIRHGYGLAFSILVPLVLTGSFHQAINQEVLRQTSPTL
jgi:hypothetical protein